MSIPDTIRTNILFHLSRLDKQQKELAEYLKISGASVTGWLREGGSPRMDKLDAICEFLHISPAQLVTERRPGLYQCIIGEDENRILSKYSDLNMDGRKKVEEYTDLLLSSHKYEKGVALSHSSTA